MKSREPDLIPIPIRQRWLDARLRILPFVVFTAALGAIVFLWRDHISAPTLIGQAEPLTVQIGSPKAGMLTGLTVSRFQKVKAGEIVGQVTVADPQLVEASLDVIRSEIVVLKSTLQPMATQQRNAVNYVQVRLDWMRQRVTLAGTKVQLQLADAQFHRTQDLFTAKIASQSELDIAKATFDSLQKQVDELTKLVAEVEQNFKTLSPTNGPDLSTVSDESLRAALAEQESKLRLTEAELSPVMLKAPIDGIVTILDHRAGEAVIAGQPIVSIASAESARIVGYLRLPLATEPRVGTQVEVRTRGTHRVTAPARILAIGGQLETIPPVYLGLAKLDAAFQGLPVDISLPANLTIHPGELVDITMNSETE